VVGRLVLAILTSARDTDDPSIFNVPKSSVEGACTCRSALRSRLEFQKCSF
jgi:hypothetical protein